MNTPTGLTRPQLFVAASTKRVTSPPMSTIMMSNQPNFCRTAGRYQCSPCITLPNHGTKALSPSAATAHGTHSPYYSPNFPGKTINITLNPGKGPLTGRGGDFLPFPVLPLVNAFARPGNLTLAMSMLFPFPPDSLIHSISFSSPPSPYGHSQSYVQLHSVQSGYLM